ncbi:PAS domain-containing protein [Pseudomonas sp. RP23018S]|uniref:sensor histidine kinase n=1 Tax=Pseudomonas sp. RP23018S TaxID=3096037 RepID=UPI002ACA3B16|nr:PAS domain-containing protein [Pseudomonas sp. RP23018S]MDZ5602007.1 PAS domain-containing protein [Pseudomonas sp. RP23018S]
MTDTAPEETIRTALQISHARLRKQHELVVEFGVASLKLLDTDSLLTLACNVVAQGLKTRFAKVLQPASQDHHFLLTHGVGWDASDIGTATVGADESSPAGYAFLTSRPVISNHLGLEQRFRTPSLLKQYGIERAINVPIQGASCMFGVLEADSGEGDDFIESDIVFMGGVANVIAMSLERLTLHKEQHASGAGSYSESVLNASPDCVKILSAEGVLEFFNQAGLCEMQIGNPQQVYGKLWADLWPSASKTVVTDAVARVAAGESVRFESFCPTLQGEPRWWDVTMAPITDEQGATDKIIAVSRDITERHDHETALAELIEVQNQKINASDLQLEEIHHRIRNSLHLVNTLLLLQANLSPDEAVKGQLQAAAGRVVTIAKVHERLYQTAKNDALSVHDYLHCLLEDIGSAFLERPIKLTMAALALPVDRMAPLGLVISELITNALKYGKGAITVSLEDACDHALLTVTDEGDGFPEHYPKPSGTGLGMRLVKGYSGFGSDAVSVDRNSPTSSIQVKFRL